MKKKKKSRFQQRLEEMQLKHNVETGDSGPGNLNLHEEEAYNPNVHGNRGWFCARLHSPPYYVPVDIWVGQDILKDWYRVSDGDNDYYCNQRDNKVIREPSHWAKRTGVVYPKYDPMTEDDVKQVMYPDLPEVIELLEKEMVTHTFITEYNSGFNAGLSRAIIALNKFIKKKRMTEE